MPEESFIPPLFKEEVKKEFEKSEKHEEYEAEEKFWDETVEKIAKQLEEEEKESETSEKKELEDVDNYFTDTQQLDLVSNSIDLITAKKYKIETTKNPLRGKKPTKVFLAWLSEHEEKTSKTPYQLLQEKTKEPESDTEIKEKIVFDDDPLRNAYMKEALPAETPAFDKAMAEKVKLTKNVLEKEPEIEKVDLFNDSESKIESVMKILEEDPHATFAVDGSKIKKDDIGLFTTAEKKKKSSEIISSKKMIFNMKTYPIIILLWGYDGTSKSEQLMKFVDDKGRRLLIFDFENKLRALAGKLNFPQENIITSGKYNEAYNIDGPTTLRELRIVLHNIKEMIKHKPEKRNFAGLGLDGISDIRPFAKDEWILEKKNRKAPVTPGDWSAINDKVKDIVFVLINIGRAEEIHIFLTAQVGADYKNGQKVGDIPDCKDWIWHNVDHKFRLWKDEEQKKFYAICEKSFYDPFWIVDLTDWTHNEKPSLMNILQSSELIKKHIEEYEKLQQEITEKISNSVKLF